MTGDEAIAAMTGGESISGSEESSRKGPGAGPLPESSRSVEARANLVAEVLSDADEVRGEAIHDGPGARGEGQVHTDDVSFRNAAARPSG